MKLTNGSETFEATQIASDERGPASAKDSRGSSYDRCEAGACEHEHAPVGATVWHDAENTEELWEA